MTEDLLGGSVAEMDDKEREEKLAKQEMKALQDAVIEIFVNLCGSDNSVKVFSSLFKEKRDIITCVQSCNVWISTIRMMHTVDAWILAA